jgi:hypothetical protein
MKTQLLYFLISTLGENSGDLLVFVGLLTRRNGRREKSLAISIMI